MYEQAKSLGISLITITHRSSLWKFHTHLLQFDGEGGWHLEPLDASSRLTLKEQKDKLERELSELPDKQTQLKQLCDLLGEDSHLLPTMAVVDSTEIDDQYHSLEEEEDSESSRVEQLKPNGRLNHHSHSHQNGHVKFSDTVKVNGK